MIHTVGLPNLDGVVRVKAEAPEDCLVRRTYLGNPGLKGDLDDWTKS